MRVACLVSGGKDSILAAQVVRDAGWELDSFLTLLPKAEAPLLFHKPNARWVELQARAAGVPWDSEDVADEADELPALKRLLSRVKADGIVAGALASEYQRTRFERAAHEAGLKTFTPLWHHDPQQHLQDVLSCGLGARFAHVAAEGLGKEWLGRPLDEASSRDLASLHRRTKLNPAGEGGEYETFVEDAPLFSARIMVLDSATTWHRDAGSWAIRDARLESKRKP
jgi:diphthine-ammonia ligase